MEASSDSAPQARVVIYFDGVCNLCNGFVDFLIRRDRERQLRYASQQGPGFAAIRSRHPELTQIDTIVAVVEEGGVETVRHRSDAALFALARLPGAWGCAGWLRVIPGFVRDAVYDFIARNRYALFGKRETCRLPGPEERALFVE